MRNESPETSGQHDDSKGKQLIDVTTETKKNAEAEELAKGWRRACDCTMVGWQAGCNRAACEGGTCRRAVDSG